MSETTPVTELQVVELPKEMTVVVSETGIAPITAQAIFMAYKPYVLKINELLEEAKKVDVTDATQVSLIKKARELRLALRGQRVAADKEREKLKADAMRHSNAVQGFFNVVKLMTEPIEEKLLAAEQFAERKEAERKAALKTQREEALKPFGVDTSFYQLADMPDDAFAKLLDGTKAAHEAQQAAAKKAEEERIAKEKAEAAERERVRLENERLKKEFEEREKAAAAERERAAAEKAELERKAAEADKARQAAEAQAKRDREDADRRHAEEVKRKEQEAIERTERELAEQRKRNEEIARKEKEEREAFEAAEKKKRDAAAAAEKKKRDAELADAKRKADEAAAAAQKAKEDAEIARKHEADRLAAEKAKADAAEAAARAAAAAPDKEKMAAISASIRAIKVPQFSTEEGKKFGDTLFGQYLKLADWVDSQAAKL